MKSTVQRLLEEQRKQARLNEATATVDSPVITATMAFARLMALPATRGFWPFTSIDGNADAVDMSGQNRLLSGNGTQTFGVMANGGAYAVFNGASTYYNRADEAGLDITTDLTLLGWFYVAASTTQAMVSKVNTNQISYQLNTTSANKFQFTVSSNGTAMTSVTASADYTENAWYFVAGRYTASTELSIIWKKADVDATTAAGTRDTNTTSIPASIHSGTAEFRIGANQSGPALMTGRAAYVALVTYALSNDYLDDLYEGTRPLFMT